MEVLTTAAAPTMKLLVDHAVLRDALQRVDMAIERRPTKPALGGVQVRAQKDRVLVEATDLEVAVRYEVQGAQVDVPGWAVAPGRQLVDVVQDFDAEMVSIALRDGRHLELDAGEDRCVLTTIENSAEPEAAGSPPRERSSQFPEIPELQGEPSVALERDAFLQMIASTRFAASRVHDSRFPTEGILFEARDGEVTMVGTDGRRLACIRRPLQRSGGQRQRCVLLPKVLDQIARYGREEPADAPVEVFFLGNQVGFRVGRLQAFGRVLEGDYPNYDSVIPRGGKHVVRAQRDALAKKLQLASHLTAEAAPVVRIQVAPGSMEVSAEHEGRGRAAATLEVDYDGPGFTVLFNPTFLLDGLKAAHGSEVELQLDDPARPAKFALGEAYTYVVMPLSTFA